MSKPKTKVLPPLSFMKDVPDGKRATRRIFWSVEPSGDYIADNERGFAYAAEFFARVQQTNFPGLLNLIIKDMVEAGRFGGVEVGFIERIGQFAKLGNSLALQVDGKDGAA